MRFVLSESPLSCRPTAVSTLLNYILPSRFQIFQAPGLDAVIFIPDKAQRQRRSRFSLSSLKRVVDVVALDTCDARRSDQ
jgi:hypothetical protein